MALASEPVQAGDSGPVKIGVSKSPEDRMRSLQIGCGETLRLLGKAPGDGADTVIDNKHVQIFHQYVPSAGGRRWRINDWAGV